LNTPHFHPRATEFLYLVSKGEMLNGFIEENGARFVVNTMSEGQGALIPKGSIHFQANLGCEPLTFVAALNNEDPGVNQIAQRCEYPELLLWFGADDRTRFFLKSSVSRLMSWRPLLEMLGSRRLLGSRKL
jgi:hypothetical protein